MAPAFTELEPSHVDSSLAAEGAEKIAWAGSNMPVLAALHDAFADERPLAGRRIGMCLHVEMKTAVLTDVLRAGGAEIVWTGSPATTDDTVAAAAAERGIVVYARRADTMRDHERHVERVLASDPDLLLDNGADLIAAAVDGRDSRVTAATEETTSGRNRLLGELAGRLPFPVVVINDSPIKLLFENEHGIGPAVVDGFMRATNSLIAGKTFAVAGYGSCGRSLARTLRALGAVVIVVELDEVRALEAAFDGMRVASLRRAAGLADAIFTVTGRPGVLRGDDLLALRDGTMLANVGHFGNEIAVDELESLATERRRAAKDVVEYRLPNGRAVRLLAGGEMLNLAAATGHQMQIMDLGFALQAHSMRELALRPEQFSAGYQPVPPEIDRAVAAAALRTLSTIELDEAGEPG
jgi:adenosylhomocysteinase